MGVTEGVSSDGCSGPTGYSQFFIDSEIFERLRSSKYTPSQCQSPARWMFRQRAGDFCEFCVGVCFAIQPGTCETVGLAGDFHRPYATQNILAYTIHRSTLPQLRCAQQLPQRGRRDWCVPFNRVLAKIPGYGRFSSPLRNSECLTVPIHRGTEERLRCRFGGRRLRRC